MLCVRARVCIYIYIHGMLSVCARVLCRACTRGCVRARDGAWDCTRGCVRVRRGCAYVMVLVSVCCVHGWACVRLVFVIVLVRTPPPSLTHTVIHTHTWGRRSEWEWEGECVGVCGSLGTPIPVTITEIIYFCLHYCNFIYIILMYSKISNTLTISTKNNDNL